MLRLKSQSDRNSFLVGVSCLSLIGIVAIVLGLLDKNNSMDYFIPSLACIGGIVFISFQFLTNKKQFRQGDKQ